MCGNIYHLEKIRKETSRHLLCETLLLGYVQVHCTRFGWSRVKQTQMSSENSKYCQNGAIEIGSVGVHFLNMLKYREIDITHCSCMRSFISPAAAKC